MKRQSLFVVGLNLNLTTRWFQFSRAPVKQQERRAAINLGIREQEHENSISRVIRGVPNPLPVPPVSPPSVPIKSPTIPPHPPITSSLPPSVEASAKIKSQGKRVSLVDVRDSVDAEAAEVASHRGKIRDSSAATSRKKTSRNISQLNSSENCSTSTTEPLRRGTTEEDEEELSGRSRNSLDVKRRQRRCSTTRNKTFPRQFGKVFHRRSILQIPRLDFPRSRKTEKSWASLLVLCFTHKVFTPHSNTNND